MPARGGIRGAGTLGAFRRHVRFVSPQRGAVEIEVKWNKFSKHDLSALKNKDDLVTQVVAKYGLEKATAQLDVDALLKGRAI
jgi:hypothetical protein